MKFSERIGKAPVKSIIQKDSMDKDLRNALWNTVTIFCWMRLNRFTRINIKSEFSDENILLIKIWIHFFKEKIDEIPDEFGELLEKIKRFFDNAIWYEIYNFIEFVVNDYRIDRRNNKNQKFINACNEVLERELSAYRFVGGIITPIMDKIEIEAIEEALQQKDEFSPVQVHLNSAIELFSDRKSPDYRNSIKESISAVESYCKISTGDDKATLKLALEKFCNKNNIHPALQKAFNNLYGYTSDANGIRHALLENDNLNQEDAKFMLVACSAFLNFLKQKETKQ